MLPRRIHLWMAVFDTRQIPAALSHRRICGRDLDLVHVASLYGADYDGSPGSFFASLLSLAWPIPIWRLAFRAGARGRPGRVASGPGMSATLANVLKCLDRPLAHWRRRIPVSGLVRNLSVYTY